MRDDAPAQDPPLTHRKLFDKIEHVLRDQGLMAAAAGVYVGLAYNDVKPNVIAWGVMGLYVASVLRLYV